MLHDTLPDVCPAAVLAPLYSCDFSPTYLAMAASALESVETMQLLPLDLRCRSTAEGCKLRESFMEVVDLPSTLLHPMGFLRDGLSEKKLVVAVKIRCVSRDTMQPSWKSSS
eukprot:2074688-Amphidinium_carterae.1